MIKINNITKEYKNGVVALSNIDLEISKGEFVFLVGSSGAGKSTLVKLLLKEEKPTEGQIYFKGIDITHASNRKVPLLRREIGVVFQDFRLLPNKTVFENVAFALEIIGTPMKEIKRRVPVILSLVNLSRRATSFPEQLSGGEQQRVSIARAIVNNPPVLIADEPTGNLDPETAWEIMKVLKDVNNRGTTVIMATHAREIVNSMRKRVVALDNGKIVRDDVKGGYEFEIPIVK